MAGRKLPPERVREVLDHLAGGMSLSQASRTCGVSLGFVHGLHHKMGGVYRPAAVSYSARYLDREERYEIARLREAGLSMRQVAVRTGRSPSTISRELARNADPRTGGTCRSGRTGWPGSGSGGRSGLSWPATRCCARGCSGCWTGGTHRSRPAGG
jgi:transposase